jgi:hypothetical protein
MNRKPTEVPRTAKLFLADRPDEVIRRRALTDLLEAWMNDTSGYDEEVWPELKRALDENRTAAGDQESFLREVRNSP